jgi:hypothetical protein
MKDKHVDTLAFGNSEGKYFNKITYVRLESNTCLRFLSSSQEDQSNVFLIRNGIQCEYFGEMIIDLPYIAECAGEANGEE